MKARVLLIMIAAAVVGCRDPAPLGVSPPPLSTCSVWQCPTSVS